jgi:two-component system alkaline phosphatase synthesis response regulator PhoP
MTHLTSARKNKIMPRVMVVDDDWDITQIVSEKLRLAGYDVVTACDGNECLEIIRREKPNLVLLDVMMPDLDGLEVCREIKRNLETKNIKVAVFTVKSSARDREISAEYFADAHIGKPVSTDMLIKIVEKLLKD